MRFEAKILSLVGCQKKKFYNVSDFELGFLQRVRF